MDGQLGATWGDIEKLTESGGTIRLANGQERVFTAGQCCRDGTSFAYLRIGDRVRLEPAGGISSPNNHRWGAV